jgi:hypothetical protein
MTEFDVFISCAHSDRAAGDAVAAALERAGFSCWNAAAARAGTDWAASITDAIRHCRAMVLIFSSHTNASRWTQTEVETAVTRRIPILAIRIEDVQPAGRLAYFLETIPLFEAGRAPIEAYLDAVTAVVASSLNKPAAAPVRSARPAADKPAELVATQPAALGPAPAPPQYARTTPEYWLHRVAVERKLAPGDQPLVLISFASEDQPWVDDLRAFLDPKIELLRDKHGAPYHLWNFSDARRGTAPGDEFPEIVAEKMWRCQAALLLLSSSYFRSGYCKSIELPFLMWRRDHHQLSCLPLKIGTIPVDRVRLPAYGGASRHVVIGELIDDRQAADDFAKSEYRDLNLRQLRERRIESEIETRFDGIGRRVTQFLRTQYGAVEVE